MSPGTLPPKGPGKAETSAGGEPVTVLAIGSGSGRQDLRRIIGHSRWTLLEADTLAEAMARVRSQGSVVLVCEPMLPDGSWLDVLAECRKLRPPPPVIVAAQHADDRLWMEVLNRGAYNLLGKPFVEKEVFQVVSAAWLHLTQLRPGLRAAVR